MLDRDLAKLYDVTTGNLNKAVKRNIERFPERFMFQLTKEEFEHSVMGDEADSRRVSNYYKLREILEKIPSLELTGPFSPQIDRLRGVHLKCFYIKFARNKDLAENKRGLYESLREFVDKGRLIIDVDPL
mgnify:CR=1 FL=1